MRFSKITADRYFKISVESALIDEDNESSEIPATSLLSLILELELLAAELRKLLDDERTPLAH